MKRDETSQAQRREALRQLQRQLADGAGETIDRALLARLQARVQRVQDWGGDYRFVSLSPDVQELIEPNRPTVMGMDSLEAAVRPRGTNIYS